MRNGIPRPWFRATLDPVNQLRLRLTLKLNLDETGDWFQAAPPAPLTFDMTASYVTGFRDMESGKPTSLFDVRWTRAKASSASGN